MDIGSLVQGLQMNASAFAVPAAQGGQAESSGEAFDVLLQPEGEAGAEGDQNAWQAWSASAQAVAALVAPMVALPQTLQAVADAGTTTVDESGTASGTAPSAAVLAGPDMKLSGLQAFQEEPVVLPKMASPLPAPETLSFVDGSSLSGGVIATSPTAPDFALAGASGVPVLLPDTVPLAGLAEQAAPNAIEGRLATLAPGQMQALPPAPGTALKAMGENVVSREPQALLQSPPSMSAFAQNAVDLAAQRDGVQSAVQEAQGSAASQTQLKTPVPESPKALGYWRLVLAGALDEAPAQNTLPVEGDAEGSTSLALRAAPAMIAQGHIKAPEAASPAVVGLEVGARTDLNLNELNPGMDDTAATDVSSAREDRSSAALPSSRADTSSLGTMVPLSRYVSDMSSLLMASGSPEALVPSLELQLRGATEAAFQAFEAGAQASMEHQPEVLFRAASIEQVQAEGGLEMTEIRLDPEELGRLRITLEGDGEALRIRVEVERPETLDLLRRNMERLAETLREAGYTQSDMQFSTWSGQRQHQPDQAVFDVDAAIEVEPIAKALHPVAFHARSAAAADGLNLRL